MCTTRRIFQQLLGTGAHAVWLPWLFILKHYRFVLCWREGGGDERYEQTVWPWHSDSGFALMSPENGLKLLPQTVHHMLKTAQESALISTLIRAPCLLHRSTDCSNNIRVCTCACVSAHVFVSASCTTSCIHSNDECWCQDCVPVCASRLWQQQRQVEGSDIRVTMIAIFIQLPVNTHSHTHTLKHY